MIQIFTSYFGNRNNLLYRGCILPNDLISISRYDCNFVKGKVMKSEKILAPSVSLLWNYKNGVISWKDYCLKFYDYLYNLDKKYWDNFLKNNFGKVFMCYEKDYKHCHRYLVSKFVNWYYGEEIMGEWELEKHKVK